MLFEELLTLSREQRASDIHLVYGELPTFRVNGELIKIGDELVNKRFLSLIVDLILSERERNIFYQNRELDCSFEDSNNLRYRGNFHWERGNIGISIRLIENSIKSMEELGLPKILKKLIESKKGLILITGPSGSGKSTTLASMVEELNSTKNLNIITLEDPIEYLFKSKKSLIRQREIGRDTHSFAQGLKSVLRQDPDVIMVGGELRDRESIAAALTASETGHLVLGTLHTNSASETISRIVDVFPTEEQNEIRVKLATTLKGVVSQRLVRTKERRRGAYEILLSIPAVSNLILGNKLNQIDSVIESNKKMGMILMRNYLEDLYSQNIISKEEYIDNLR